MIGVIDQYMFEQAPSSLLILTAADDHPQWSLCKETPNIWL